jgi:hypothetical protein
LQAATRASGNFPECSLAFSVFQFCLVHAAMELTRPEHGGEMDSSLSRSTCGLLLVATLFLSACAGYSGSNLKPGASTLPEVTASMGEPAITWKNPDGSEQLAFPRGPAGTQTFMAYIGPDGKLQRIEAVLNMAHFARIRAGMSKDDVQRVIGPPWAPWTQLFASSNTLAWSWLFCDSFSLQTFFDVLFDASAGKVRSTQQRPNYVGFDGVQPTCGQ